MSNHKGIISRVEGWVVEAVIGLDLCPFAKAVYRQNKLHYVVSESETVDNLMLELFQQCQFLIENPDTETTLLIIPYQLAAFSQFNQMLDQADALLEVFKLTGVFQIASFHPKYRFENTRRYDRENWTNRAPFPVLQILRESSIDLAVSMHPNPARISEKNIRTLKAMDAAEFKRVFKTSDCYQE